MVDTIGVMRNTKDNANEGQTMKTKKTSRTDDAKTMKALRWAAWRTQVQLAREKGVRPKLVPLRYRVNKTSPLTG